MKHCRGTELVARLPALELGVYYTKPPPCTCALRLIRSASSCRPIRARLYAPVGTLFHRKLYSSTVLQFDYRMRIHFIAKILSQLIYRPSHAPCRSRLDSKPGPPPATIPPLAPQWSALTQKL